MKRQGRYQAAFLRELERLNPAQRQAVEQLEGPVLVIAGPGTGKTHLLGARIGRILIETDTQPQNILCLTFTDAGVRAMRERLLQFIGPAAYRVHIYTFHSFCNSVIQDNLERFGRQDLAPITDLERVELIRGLIDQLDLNHPLRRGKTDPYFYEKHLADLFQRMKAEHWTPEYIDRQIDAYLRDIPRRPAYIYQVSRGDFRKGDPKKALLNEERERMERLRAAAALFPRYQETMQRSRRYDYDDMILWVLQAFREHEALLRAYQEQYLYFLVDEYQDTNGAQNEIIHQLIEYWSNPNVFIVGDDDQSIYEFQGARLKNLTDFYHKYERDLRLVILTDNYRSSQPILDHSGALIAHNRLRIVNQLQELGLEKVLTARSPDFADLKVFPRLTEFPNLAQEEAAVVEAIEALLQKGARPDDVAVIYAKHRQGERLADLLSKKNLPFNTRRRLNILHLPMIQNLRELLQYLELEFRRPYQGEHLLFRILHFDFIGADTADLARLSLLQAQKPGRSRRFWRDLLREADWLQAQQLNSPGPLLRFGKLIGELLTHRANLSLPRFLERLINRSGFLHFQLTQPDRIWRSEVLRTFIDFAVGEAERRPRLTLGRLLDILQKLDDNRLPIELYKVVTDQPGVNLLTAHSAKGLEFDHVFLINAVKDHWEPRSRGSAYRFPLPDSITYSGEEDALEARRRLFYVAMTRARSSLRISYSAKDHRGQDKQRAVFIDEIAQSTGLAVETRTVPADTVAGYQSLLLTEADQPARVAPYEKAAVDRLLEGFTLSISALNRYLRCPLAFFFEQVLRAPVLYSEAASFGTAMHNALQRLFQEMIEQADRRSPPADRLVLLFTQEMERLQRQFSRETFERRLHAGRQYLSAYYRQEALNWPREVRVELNITKAEVDGVPITGAIDRVDLLDGQSAHVLDYKTGSQRKGKLRRPTERQPLGGNYWRQLVFYKLLYENGGQGPRRVSKGSISYLEPDSQGRFPVRTIDFLPEDVRFLRKLIVDTYEKILAHDFYQGCGEPQCSWCNFIRHHAPVDSLAQPDIEELDD